MAHAHKLEIFRGLIKFKSNTQKIWGVFITFYYYSSRSCVRYLQTSIFNDTSMTPFEVDLEHCWEIYSQVSYT